MEHGLALTVTASPSVIYDIRWGGLAQRDFQRGLAKEVNEVDCQNHDLCCASCRVLPWLGFYIGVIGIMEKKMEVIGIIGDYNV